MKKQLLSLVFICAVILAYGQDTYTLQIVDTQNQPLKNTEVRALNSEKKVTLKATTDNTGTVVFTLSAPGKYTFSYLTVVDATSYTVREGGGKGFSEKRITYDPKKVFAVQPNASRTGIVFKSVPAQQLKGQPNMAKVTIEVLSSKEEKVPSVLIELVSCTDQCKYKGYANGIGQCVFFVPNNKEYEIDVEHSEALAKFNIPNYQNLQMEQTAYYEKMKVNEVVKGDSIFQNEVAQTGGTNSHVLFILTLKDFDNNLLNNEFVYVNSQNKKRIYVGKTDDKGICKLMLEKGDDYLVNLKYERDIRLIEAKNINGFATFTSTRRYRGSLLVEKIMAEQKAEMKRVEEEQIRLEKERVEWEKGRAAREKEMIAQQKSAEEIRKKLNAEFEQKIIAKAFVPTYNQTPVQRADVPTNYLKKTAKGFDIDFKSSGPIGTPTIVDDKLFTQEGFYSPNFYCLNSKTGQYVWGVELGESGISPAVYHNGIILVNTYSCTLYALDAVTGALLWSKWLAGTIYSTPSAADNSVYVVYNHGGRYVIVSFNLKTGAFNWMRTIDNESIACPVVDGNEVHVASRSGNYYVFNKDTGNPIINSTTVHAVTSPTIGPDKIFITAAINGIEQLVILDRKTLKIDKKYTAQLNRVKTGETHGCFASMNFNGSHPVVYQNKYVILADGQKVIAFDATSEKTLWKQPLVTSTSQIPIVANNKVMITSSTGQIMVYDINTGTPQKIEEKAGGNSEGQPIASQGFIYIASAGILSVCKSVQNFQWNQWNKDASHNAYLK